VNVKTSEARDIEDALGQDLAIGHHDDEIRRQLAQLGDEGFFAGACGLEHGQVVRQGDLFYGTRLNLQVAAFGFVGLRDDGADGEIGRAQKGFKAGARQIGGAYENDVGFGICGLDWFARDYMFARMSRICRRTFRGGWVESISWTSLGP
jgi:hypothetical protein